MTELLKQIEAKVIQVDYERDKNIDVHNLHQEWLRQHSLAMDYITLESQTEKEKDKIREQLNVAKANLDKAKALLENKIRKTPLDYDPPMKKVKKGKEEAEEPDLKESWFASALLINMDEDEDCKVALENYRQLNDELIDVNYKLNLYKGAVKAMGVDRKAGIEGVVALWMKGYFSIPKLPKEVAEGDFTKQSRDEISQKQGAALNRSRRKL